MDCEILFAKTSLKIDKFFLSFSTLFSDFSWTCKSISQQNLFVKALFRNTLSFLNVWFYIQGGEHWWICVLIMMHCKLSDSLTRTLTIWKMILFWYLFYDDLFIHAKLAPKRILMLCLKCLHNVLKHNWNQYKIWKYTYVHSFPCPTIKYDKCDLMHFHMTIMRLLPLWH